MEQARAGVEKFGIENSSDEEEERFRGPQSPANLDSPRPTHVSGSSSFVSAAKNIVGSFGCSSGRKNKAGQRDISPPSAASTNTTRKTLSMSSASNYTRR